MKNSRVLAIMLSATLFLNVAVASEKTWLPQAVGDEDYYFNGEFDAGKVELGEALFFDKVLSGNLNISCASCHHPFTGTADGLSLSVGEGGRGLGATRHTGVADEAVHERVPRNAPALFNLGAREFSRLFHDGRVEQTAAGIVSPAGTDLPAGLDNPLAVQAMFPVTSATEMAGQAGENPIADAAVRGDLAGPDGVWEQLAERLRGIDEYSAWFIEVFDDIDTAEDISFVHAANAIAAFEARTWRADNSAFDRYLRGERAALSQSQRKGMRLFYSPRKAACANCHSGAFQTDHSFRAIAMPQIGPGKGDGERGDEDFGREQVTALSADRYRFRVPTLRNIELTGPYGHAGAFDSLEGVLRHHMDAVESLYEYTPEQLVLPARADLDNQDLQVLQDETAMSRIAAANEMPKLSLSEQDIGYLLDFLHALTDPAMLETWKEVPMSVPSGLLLAE